MIALPLNHEEFEQERSPEPEYPCHDVDFSFTVLNGIHWATARAIHKMPASFCGPTPSATHLGKSVDDYAHPLIGSHYNWACETNKMPCSQCGGPCTKMSMQLKPHLHEEPYRIDVNCVPICHGRECIYKCRLQVASKKTNENVSHQQMAQNLSLGECWVCKTRNSSKYCKGCGVVAYCSVAGGSMMTTRSLTRTFLASMTRKNTCNVAPASITSTIGLALIVS